MRSARAWQRHDPQTREGLLMMTFGQFSQANRTRCESPQGFKHKLNGWSLSDWMTATLGELGEAANIVKKLNRVREGVPGNKESEAELRAKLKREIGDTFVYLDLLAQSAGFSVADAAAEVFNSKSEEIGYPIKL
jgi:NTP pyrophosphatase (non-canonical NTP hydrolase)